MAPVCPEMGSREFQMTRSLAIRYQNDITLTQLLLGCIHSFNPVLCLFHSYLTQYQHNNLFSTIPDVFISYSFAYDVILILHRHCFIFVILACRTCPFKYILCSFFLQPVTYYVRTLTTAPASSYTSTQYLSVTPMALCQKMYLSTCLDSFWPLIDNLFENI